jgi:hypothetical protein
LSGTMARSFCSLSVPPADTWSTSLVRSRTLRSIPAGDAMGGLRHHEVVSPHTVPVCNRGSHLHRHLHPLRCPQGHQLSVTVKTTQLIVVYNLIVFQSACPYCHKWVVHHTEKQQQLFYYCDKCCLYYYRYGGYW